MAPRHVPRYNDQFYDKDKSQPNGKIVKIGREDVVVLFHDGEREVYNKSEIRDKWTDSFGGTYRLNE